MNSRGCIVLFSGGLDSTTLLYYVLKGRKPEDVKALSVIYGQRHLREIECAKETCKKLGVEHQIVELHLEKLLDNSALIDHGKKLPEEHYTHESQKVTVVPGRNQMMISIAVAWADNIGAKKVYYAAHANDRAIYKDCRYPFVNALSRASRLGTDNEVEVVAPFVNKYKSELVKIGTELGVAFALTWSCYKGGKKACGLCGTCQERVEAFKKNGLKDPLPYEIEVDWSGK